jgi:hypothetical protein
VKHVRPPNYLIAKAILKYLMAHQNAKDTLLGVALWWLGERKSSLEKVQEVLEFFVSVGWLKKKQTPIVETLYGLNKRCLPEIRAFIKKEEVVCEKKKR